MFWWTPKFWWTVTLDSIYVSVMQLHGTWNNPPLKEFSQYPSFPLVRTVSIAVRPSSATHPMSPHPPPPKIHLAPAPLHTKTSCLDPSAPWGSTAPRRSTVPPSVSAPLL